MPASLLPVVERLFDDAGLFPPANHAMADALVLHDRARRGPYGRLVGPFLCPYARLDELEACVAGGAPRPPELGLVVHPGETPWRRITLRPGVVQVEAPLGAVLPEDAVRLARYVELSPRADVEEAVDDIARSHARVTVRCGGLTPDATPSSAWLAAVLVACARRRVALKTSAGLHRPFRHTSESGVVEHGYLNLLAAASAAAVGEPVDSLVDILETDSEDGGKLVMRIDRSARSLLASIATPSIDVPVDGLRQLGLL